MEFASKNINLDTESVKERIFKYLYTRIKSHNHKIKYLVSVQDVECIKNDNYIICPEFSGTRVWIIFAKINNCYYSINFSKDKNHQQKIYPIDISIYVKLYEGTIMEGIYYQQDNKKFWIIDEVYILAGQNELLKSKSDRLDVLNKYLNENIKKNSVFNLYVSKYYSLAKSELQDLYEIIKLNPSIEGLIFYPKIFGGKIYKYTIMDEDLVENIIKIMVYTMRKTANTDVYNLFNGEEKIGIAYIPDIETSKMCRQWFKSTKKSKLNVKCKLDPEKNKWIPMELVEN